MSPTPVALTQSHPSSPPSNSNSPLSSRQRSSTSRSVRFANSAPTTGSSPNVSNSSLSQPFLVTRTSTAATLTSLPSLSIDEAHIDSCDVDISIGYIPRLVVYGPWRFRHSATDRSNARTSALRKLNTILSEHGLADLSLRDYVRALRVFPSLVRRKSIAKRSTRAVRETEMPHKPEDAVVALTLPAPAAPMPFKPPSSAPGSSPQLTPSSSRLRGSMDVLRGHETRPVLHAATSPGSLRRTSGEFASAPELSSAVPTSVSIPVPIARIKGSIEGLRFHKKSGASNPRDGPGTRVTLSHVQLIHHMLRHAEAIYGLPLNVASGPRTALLSVTDRNIVVKRTGILPDDLLLAQFSSDAYLPAHYVAIDRRVRAIVVCVRGTANIVDSLTDVAATHDPFHIVASMRTKLQTTPANPDGARSIIEGHGHAGVLRSARKLFEAVRDVVLDACDNTEDYDILITGHSLGGAVGAVLALILREDADVKCRARAICIGPPPCLSQNIADDSSDSVVSIVNGSDIVPRLTVGVLLPYFSTCRYVRGLSKAKKIFIDMGLQSVAVDWDYLMKISKEEQLEARNELEPNRLYVPGLVLQLVHPKDVKHQEASSLHLFKSLEVDIIRVPRTNLARIRREKDMFLSHAPHKYRKNLVAALKSLGGGRLRRSTNSGTLLSSLSSLYTSIGQENIDFSDSSSPDAETGTPPRPVEMYSGDIVFPL